MAQVILAATEEGRHVGAVADGTDIYVNATASLLQPIILIPTRQERALIDTGLGELCFELLPAHVLPAYAVSRCVQVPMHYGIGES